MKKNWKLFVLFGIGAVIGIISAISDQPMGMNMQTIFNGIDTFVLNHVLEEVIVVCGIMPVIHLILAYSGRKQFVESIEKDEKENDRLLSVASVLANIGIFTTMAISMTRLVAQYESNFAMFMSLMFLVLFSLIVNLYIITFVVKVLKKHNPLLKGDVFDPNFDRVWLESLDEREKLEYYKMVSRGFRVMQIVCIIAVIIASLYVLTVNGSTIAVLLILAIFISGMLATLVQPKK